LAVTDRLDHDGHKAVTDTTQFGTLAIKNTRSSDECESIIETPRDGIYFNT
jgi:hypothetical protein